MARGRTFSREFKLAAVEEVVSRWRREVAERGEAAFSPPEPGEQPIARMSMPIQANQVDGRSEFMAGFETACQQREIALTLLPPRSPKRNGRVERLNGTVRREFWECYDGDLDLPTLQIALQHFEDRYSAQRPHQVLGYRTPREHLASLNVS